MKFFHISYFAFLVLSFHSLALGEFSLLPSEATSGEIEVASADGRLVLSAKGEKDAELIVGGNFIGIRSPLNSQNAAVNADGALPADEYFELSLGAETGLSKLCVIWTRADLTITGFNSNPGVVLQGSGDSAFDASTGTLTIRQPWTAGNKICYTFLNPQASSGRTLSVYPLDANAPNPAVAIAEIQYVHLEQQSAIATPERYLQHFPQLLEARWPNNRTVNIVIYGDSTSYGYNAKGLPGFFNAYPNFLRGLLKERYPYAVINVIATGRYGLNSSDAMSDFQANVLDHRPDLLIIDFGKEDVKGNQGTALEALSQIIQKARDNALRVILTTPPVPEQYEGHSPAELALGIVDLAHEEDVGVVDIFARLRDWGGSLKTPFEDDILTADGHWVIARELLNWFPENPLSSISSGFISSACDSDEVQCSFTIEGMQGRTILLQRTSELNRFWSTIDVISPQSNETFQIHPPFDITKIANDKETVFYRLVLYK